MNKISYFFLFLLAYCIINVGPSTAGTQPIYGTADLLLPEACTHWLEKSVKPLHYTQQNTILNMLFILRHSTALEIGRIYAATTLSQVQQLVEKIHYYEDSQSEVALLKQQLAQLEVVLPVRKECVYNLQYMEDFIENLNDTDIDNALDVIKNIIHTYIDQMSTHLTPLFEKHLNDYSNQIPQQVIDLQTWQNLYEKLIADELPSPVLEGSFLTQKIAIAQSYSNKMIAGMNETITHNINMACHLITITNITVYILDLYYRSLYVFMQDNNRSDKAFLSLFTNKLLMLEKDVTPLPIIDNFVELYKNKIYTS